MRRIGDEERRARVGRRHRLASEAGSAEEVADAVVGLHSSDPAAVFLSAWARRDGLTPDELEAALYERRSLVRMIGMRRTLFVVPRETAAVMDRACAQALVPGERSRLVRMLEEQEIVKAGHGERWLARVAAATLASLTARGEATARQLTTDVPELAHKIRFGQGRTWGGSMGVSTRVLFLLATEGRIVRTRPLGGWTSGQYRWATTESWLGAPLPAMEPDRACTDLLGRWLRAFGPGTLTDIRWWTGWTVALARRTLDALAAVEVELDGGTGFVLPDDLEPPSKGRRWVALLPGLDPIVMAWKERGWYLGGHAAELFDRNGNAGPTVWANGRVVGGWAQNAGGEILAELVEPVDRTTRRRIDDERDRLRAWLGDVRIHPRARVASAVESRLGGG